MKVVSAKRDNKQKETSYDTRAKSLIRAFATLTNLDIWYVFVLTSYWETLETVLE